jgi:23S rRNA U2552 (ribose-2'-O)-methylase RlmE/FtsJ
MEADLINTDKIKNRVNKYNIEVKKNTRKGKKKSENLLQDEMRKHLGELLQYRGLKSQVDRNDFLKMLKRDKSRIQFYDIFEDFKVNTQFQYIDEIFAQANVESKKKTPDALPTLMVSILLFKAKEKMNNLIKDYYETHDEKIIKELIKLTDPGLNEQEIKRQTFPIGVGFLLSNLSNLPEHPKIIDKAINEYFNTNITRLKYEISPVSAESVFIKYVDIHMKNNLIDEIEKKYTLSEEIKDKLKNMSAKEILRFNSISGNIDNILIFNTYLTRWYNQHHTKKNKPEELIKVDLVGRKERNVSIINSVYFNIELEGNKYTGNLIENLINARHIMNNTVNINDYRKVANMLGFPAQKYTSYVKKSILYQDIMSYISEKLHVKQLNCSQALHTRPWLNNYIASVIHPLNQITKDRYTYILNNDDFKMYKSSDNKEWYYVNTNFNIDQCNNTVSQNGNVYSIGDKYKMEVGIITSVFNTRKIKFIEFPEPDILYPSVEWVKNGCKINDIPFIKKFEKFLVNDETFYDRIIRETAELDEKGYIIINNDIFDVKIIVNEIIFKERVMVPKSNNLTLLDNRILVINNDNNIYASKKSVDGWYFLNKDNEDIFRKNLEKNIKDNDLKVAIYESRTYIKPKSIRMTEDDLFYMKLLIREKSLVNPNCINNIGDYLIRPINDASRRMCGLKRINTNDLYIPIKEFKEMICFRENIRYENHFILTLDSTEFHFDLYEYDVVEQFNIQTQSSFDEQEKRIYRIKNEKEDNSSKYMISQSFKTEPNLLCITSIKSSSWVKDFLKIVILPLSDISKKRHVAINPKNLKKYIKEYSNMIVYDINKKYTGRVELTEYQIKQYLLLHPEFRGKLNSPLDDFNNAFFYTNYENINIQDLTKIFRGINSDKIIEHTETDNRNNLWYTPSRTFYTDLCSLKYTTTNQINGTLKFDKNIVSFKINDFVYECKMGFLLKDRSVKLVDNKDMDNIKIALKPLTESEIRSNVTGDMNFLLKQFKSRVEHLSGKSLPYEYILKLNHKNNIFKVIKVLLLLSPPFSTYAKELPERLHHIDPSKVFDLEWIRLFPEYHTGNIDFVKFEDLYNNHIFKYNNYLLEREIQLKLGKNIPIPEESIFPVDFWKPIGDPRLRSENKPPETGVIDYYFHNNKWYGFPINELITKFQKQDYKIDDTSNFGEAYVNRVLSIYLPPTLPSIYQWEDHETYPDTLNDLTNLLIKEINKKGGELPEIKFDINNEDVIRDNILSIKSKIYTQPKTTNNNIIEFKFNNIIIEQSSFLSQTLNIGADDVYSVPFKKFSDMKYELNRAKYAFSSVKLRNFDASNKIRDTVQKKLKDITITNAWIKFWEIAKYYKQLWTNKKDIKIFHNAALPGSSINAINNFLGGDINWKASSYIQKRPKGIMGPTATKLNYKHGGNKSLLDDQYNLLQKHAKNWYIPGDGDVTKIQNILNWEQNIKADIYFSDLGFNVTNLDEQESEHSKAHLGQLLAGLVILNEGGSLVVKMYTIFEPFTVSLIMMMNEMFREVHICKPITSRKTNSETYMVCVGFVKNIHRIDELKMRIRKFTNTPFNMRKGNIATLFDFVQKLKNIQINSMRAIVIKDNSVKERIESDYKEWFENNNPE